MFSSKFNFLLLFVLFQFWQIGWAQECRFLENVQLKPEKLAYFRDSVRFSVQGKIPIESVVTPRNPQLKLLLKTSEKSLDLGIFDLEKNLADYSYQKDFVLAFEPWMESAQLSLNFFQGKKLGDEPFEVRVIAKGIITTPFLAKIGQVNSGEAIPSVGLMMPSGRQERGISRTFYSSIQFNPGSSEFQSTDTNESVFKSLREFLIDHPFIESVKVIGLQSPEASEGRNSKLGMDRAETVKQELVSRKILLRDSLIEVNARWNDWFDFRLLLREKDDLSTERKEQYYSVLMDGTDFLDQQQKLRQIPGFSQLSQTLFPKLRAAKIEVVARSGSGLSQDDFSRLQQELDLNSSQSSLSFVDWAIAAEGSPRLEEKAEIYSKMTELFALALPYNNLAVIRIREAQQTLDLDRKEKLWDEAEWLLNRAVKIEENPYTLHNLGQIFALRGQYWDAYKFLSDASVMTRNPDFLMKNESLRGALDIIRGDYKLATLRFDYEFTDPEDFFNKGLAFYLAGDYANASIAFEESVVKDREYGYGYYGLALIAINGGQKEVALIHLERAAQTNSEIYSRVLTDPSFEELREDPEFFEILKKN
ncbi:tetratricopeptide repeat protein [Algoriphagus hitonicola]|uniref:tetratricopeptide repeat protein n=1 Tax=Algoriphagus hitonicola TaxID=435880 RepID=UPI0015A6997A|nr:tetratricopeptide repeat protein [Algoriphagus hitonicola]